jgi:thiamine-phosphate pyrophosphorylase
MNAACRLYLLTPPTLDADFPARLAAALDAGDVAAVRLALPGAPEDTLRQAAETLRPIVQSRGVALILQGDPALAVATGCDGVHVPAGTPLVGLRKLVGDLQIGASCGGSRDAAMSAGDAGADYIAFGPYNDPAHPWVPREDDEDGDNETHENEESSGAPDPELLPWWVELMELPAVAEGLITAENCGGLVRAGADFIAVGDAIWGEPDPAAAIKAMLAAIEAA